MAQEPEPLPITGLCIVAEATACPPGYELIYKSHDRSEDCDLWKDSFFKAKNRRYLCITRIFPLDQGRVNNVLADIVINNEREFAPTGFSIIEKTLDTGEKATQKKQLCTKLITRSSTNDAITELIFLSRNRRPPTGYTLVGELNGLCLCFKMGPVPPDTRTNTVIPPTLPAATPYQRNQDSHPYFGWSSPASQGSPAENLYAQQYPGARPAPPQVNMMQNSHTKSNYMDTTGSLSRQATPGAQYNPLSDVPFHFNPVFENLEKFKNFSAPDVSYRSQVDLDNEYDYPFLLERQVVVQPPARPAVPPRKRNALPVQ